MTGTRTRVFWFAQAFVAALLVVLACLVPVRPERDAPDPRSGPHGRSRSSPPSPSPSTDRSGDSLGEASRVARAPDPVPARSSGRPGRGSLAGLPYTPDQYRTGFFRSDDSYAWWDLDPLELGWLLANGRQVLTGDLEWAPESAGGLRLTRIREGSFGALRGLRVGDVVQNINGQALDRPSDVDDFLEDPAYAGAKGWRIILEREGKPFVVDFRSTSETARRERNH